MAKIDKLASIKPGDRPKVDGCLANVSLDLFQRVTLAKAKDDVRYYLNGTYIAPHAEGVIIAATNGDILLLALDRQGHCTEPTIIDLPKSALRLAKEGDRLILADSVFGKNKLHAAVQDRLGLFVDSRLASVINGKYPDVFSVIHQPPTVGVPATVQGKYMSLMAAALGKGTRYDGVRLLATADDKSVYFIPDVHPEDGEIFGAVMPMRSAMDAMGLPSFAIPQAKQKMGKAA